MATVGSDIRRVEITDEELWEDGPPHEAFKRMRSECPVHWTEKIPEFRQDDATRETKPPGSAAEGPRGVPDLEELKDEPAGGNRHVYAPRSRFIDSSDLEAFDIVGPCATTPGPSNPLENPGTVVDLKATMRAMWL